MDDNHLLNLNPQKTIRCLETILDVEELQKIQDAINENVQQLVNLSRSHLRFAESVAGRSSWRQRVSRGYYSAYCMSRAVRLKSSGYYNTDPTDHKKIGDLPANFPDKSTWEDFLIKFRADRNIADYDHTVSERALELTSHTYISEALRFYQVARNYLTTLGAI